jgi:N-acetylglucosaminyldiphosphoundecaprenol N-acetyl-beta-D-mannosaminyltransferase
MRAIRLFENVNVKPLGTEVFASRCDDLSRKVYCVLGIPIDAIDMPGLLRAVHDAASNGAPFLISTPNLHFLVHSRLDPEFRETLLLSDLCPADGMAIVWIARLIGLPIKERIAGSSMLEALKAEKQCAKRLRLFLFGGAKGVVEVAAMALNQSPSGLSCVGSIYPGYGSVAEMSKDHIIDRINASDADFLIAALSAKKGQLWLQRNHDRLQIPIRAHLGAAINFTAGNVRRAPRAIQKLGLEWLWRIKEEPRLWRRYWDDGRVLLRLLLTDIFPLAVRTRWQRLQGSRHLTIKHVQNHDTITLSLSGAATDHNVDQAIDIFRHAVVTKKKIRINLSDTRMIDARFFGLFLMLRKSAKKEGTDLKFIDVSSRLQALFRLNGVGFLLASDQSA